MNVCATHHGTLNVRQRQGSFSIGMFVEQEGELHLYLATSRNQKPDRRYCVLSPTMAKALERTPTRDPAGRPDDTSKARNS